MKLKGVNYDAGRILEGHNMRPTFDESIVKREIEIIKSDLHCNAIKIQGFDIENLMTSAEHASKQGLDVWLAPEMFEKSQDETLRYAVNAAEQAEKLRTLWHLPPRQDTNLARRFDSRLLSKLV